MKSNETKKSLKIYMAIALSLSLVVVGTTALIQMNSTADAEAVTISQNATVVTSPFTDAVKKVQASVVGVNNYTNYSNRNNGYGYYFGFGFGYGGGRDGSQEDDSRQVLQGSGSGVVVAKGYVLTNYHVVEGASNLEITQNENTYPATLAGYDETLDLAVLKADDLDLEPVVVGDSDLLNVGDWAICIGNPLSFTGTTTVGVISALNREITSTTTDAYGRRTKDVNLMIQTDAAINAGNSGGGMFNVAGELIGVPSMKYTGSYYSSTSVEGIGMAIPINVAKPLIEDVLSGKTTSNASSDEASTSASNSNEIAPATTPRIGVKVASINASNSSYVAQGLLPVGAYVDSVEAGSPAEKAGIQANDIIVEVDGAIITSTSDMTSIISAKNAGDSITVKLFRVTSEEGSPSEDLTGDYIDLTVELAILDVAQP